MNTDKSISREQFDATVLEFTKALTIKEAPGNVSKRIFARAIELTQEWYQNAEARETAFQELLSELDNESEPTEPNKKRYATAGKTIY